MRRRQVTSKFLGRYNRRGVEKSTPLFGIDRTSLDERGKDSIEDPNEDPAENRRKRRSAARNTAIGLLARREHAGSEIRRKLRDRGYDDELTHEVVDELTRQRLLSDERFAESFIRARAERGQGPVRLRAELRQLQIPGEMIGQHLVTMEMDWGELARSVRLRKFGDGAPSTLAERAKQVRFLQYRGFTADQIRAALAVSASSVDDVGDLLDSDDADSHSDTPESEY